MNFRIATLDDADKLDDLLTKLIDDERKNYDKTLEPIVVKDFYKNYISKNNYMIYLCEDQEKIIGYIYIIINEQNKAKIDALFVEKDYRKKGVASKLFELAISYLRQRRVIDIEISVMSKNIAAKKFYEKIGFTTFKEIKKLKL